MKKLSKYSRLLHWTTFLCLCLPFFYNSCGKKADAAAEEAVAIDTTSISIEKEKTISIDSIAIPKQQELIVEEEPKIEKKDEKASEIISREHTFFKPILVSKENTFSGLAILIDSGTYVLFFSLFLYAILSLLSLTIKYLDSNAIKTIALIDILALFFLSISQPMDIFYDRLWGFCVAVIFVSLLTILDIYIVAKFWKDKRNGTTFPTIY